MNQSDSVMEGTIKLPYGNVVHRLFYYYRESNKDEYNEVDCSESKMRSDDFRVDYFPKYQSV